MLELTVGIRKTALTGPHSITGTCTMCRCFFLLPSIALRSNDEVGFTTTTTQTHYTIEVEKFLERWVLLLVTGHQLSSNIINTILFKLFAVESRSKIFIVDECLVVNKLNDITAKV